MVVRNPELTVAAIRVSIAPNHIAISPPSDKPAQPILRQSTSGRETARSTSRIRSHRRSPISGALSVLNLMLTYVCAERDIAAGRQDCGKPPVDAAGVIEPSPCCRRGRGCTRPRARRRGPRPFGSVNTTAILRSPRESISTS